MSASTPICLAAMLLWLAAAATTLAAEPHTEHTFRLEQGEQRPSASLADADFLVGAWTGTAFGQQFEAVWSAPSAGSMLGMFKLMDSDQVEFYELLLLTVDDEGSLSLKVKHFNPDFTAWEDKQDFINFRLVRLSPGELHFSGISFYQRGEDRTDAYIVMREGEQLTEHPLRYQRTPGGGVKLSNTER